MFEYDHKGVGVRRVVKEASHPGVASAVAHLGGAGLGRDVEAREDPAAVGVLHVVVHHLGYPLRRFGGEQLRLAVERAVAQQRRLIHRAAVGDGGDVAQHGVGADEVLILADARPGQAHGAGPALREAAGQDVHAVELERGGHAQLLGVLGHELRAELQRQRAEGAVAGVGQRLLYGLGAVAARAGEQGPVHYHLPLAPEAALKEVGDVVYGRGQGHELEHRAGREA